MERRKPILLDRWCSSGCQWKCKGCPFKSAVRPSPRRGMHRVWDTTSVTASESEASQR